MTQPPVLDLAVLEKAAHSIFGPSYSGTWLHCAGSLIPSISAPDTAGIDAARGTIFHELMEEWQRSGPPHRWRQTKRKAFAGGTKFLIEVDDEMWDHARAVMGWIENIPGKRYIETKVDFSDLTPIPKQRGTCDLAICAPRVLRIRDWKYGTGVPVSAKDNSQGLLYAYGAFREWDWIYDFQTIEIGIAQPRLDSWTLWTVTRQELLDFAAYVKERAYLAWQPNAPFTPGNKQCRFCKVSLNCPAKSRLLDQLVDASFDDIDQPMDLTVPYDPSVRRIEPVPAHRLTNEQIGQILKVSKMMEKWLKDVREEGTRRAGQGQVIPGRRLTQGRRSKRYRLPANELITKLVALGLDVADIVESDVVSPNELEKQLRRIGIRGKLNAAYLATLVEVLPGKPTLVGDDDDRPALTDDGDIFDAEDEDL